MVRPTVSIRSSRVGTRRLEEIMMKMFSSTTTPGKKLISNACSGSSALQWFHRHRKRAARMPTSKIEITSAARQVL